MTVSIGWTSSFSIPSLRLLLWALTRTQRGEREISAGYNPQVSIQHILSLFSSLENLKLTKKNVRKFNIFLCFSKVLKFPFLYSFFPQISPLSVCTSAHTLLFLSLFRASSLCYQFFSHLLLFQNLTKNCNLDASDHTQILSVSSPPTELTIYFPRFLLAARRGFR